jgi:uncharacterized protein YqhQ
MVKVARSHPFTLGFPGLGGSGLKLLGSMVVAIILEGITTLILFGETIFIVLPILLANMFISLDLFNLFEWFSKLHKLISVNQG